MLLFMYARFRMTGSILRAARWTKRFAYGMRPVASRSAHCKVTREASPTSVGRATVANLRPAALMASYDVGTSICAKLSLSMQLANRR